MAYCSKCGKQLDGGARFCGSCGTKVNGGNDDFFNKASTTINSAINTPDYTAQFDPADIGANKVLAIMSYFGPFALIPYFCEKNSPYVRYHSVQGMYLLVCEFALWALVGVLSFSWSMRSLLSGLSSLTCLAFIVVGAYNAASGRARELPLIGRMLKLGWFK